MIRLTRVGNRPVLRPDIGNFWEKEGVFNPGITEFEGQNGKEIYMLYRAVGEKDAYISHLGLAKSKDGITFSRAGNRPVFGPSKAYDRWATEDPRITKIGDEYFITYVAIAERIMDHGHGMEREFPLEARTALLKTRDFLKFEHLGLVTPEGSDNKDVVLFPKKIPHIDGQGNVRMRYAMLHRPHRWSKAWFRTPYAEHLPITLPCAEGELPAKPSIWIAWSDDLVHFDSHKPFMAATQIDAAKNGPGLPPIETEHGWLIIYHHVTDHPTTKKLTYTAQAALFDLKDPTRCIGKLPYSILEPETEFEAEHGSSIVFPTGGYVKEDVLRVYYGCSDAYVGLATCPLSELLSELRNSDLIS